MTCVRPNHDQDLSSPEEETASSFHTPKHSSIILRNSSQCVGSLASQDSIDVFHDAFSTLHSSQKFILLNPCTSETQSKFENRKRHFSSGAKFEEKDTCDWEEETAEETSILKSYTAIKFRHSSQGKNHHSKSCNGSPYHFPILSCSTNSLKRKSPQNKKISSSVHNQTGGAVSNYISLAEVRTIRENDEGENKSKFKACTSETNCDISNSQLEKKDKKQVENARDFAKENLCKSESSHNYSKWTNSYVASSECQSLHDLTFHLQYRETQSNRSHKYHPVNFIKQKKNSLAIIKEEFNIMNFKLSHKTPHLFVTSQWQQQHKMCCAYLAYRLFWGIYFLLWAVWSWVGFAGYDSPANLKGYYTIFLTNWGIWLLTLDTLLQARNVILHMKKISEEGDGRYTEMKTSFKCSWILSNMNSTLHIFITLFFWIIVYPQNKKPVRAISVNTHIMPCVYVLLDSFISATPRRIFHAYLPMLFVTIYGIFTDIYYLSGGTNHVGNSSLYPLLDWSEQSKTLLIGSSIVLLVIPLLHIFVVCVLFALRVRLWRTWNYIRYSDMKEVVECVSMEEKV